jgi:hypothetical protein
MSDQMDPLLIRGEMAKVAMLMRVVATIPVKEILASYEHFGAFGPYFDPTGWIQTARARDENTEVLKALYPFQQLAAKFVAEADEKLAAMGGVA